jgi:hypothetical protein
MLRYHPSTLHVDLALDKLPHLIDFHSIRSNGSVVQKGHSSSPWLLNKPKALRRQRMDQLRQNLCLLDFGLNIPTKKLHQNLCPLFGWQNPRDHGFQSERHPLHPAYEDGLPRCARICTATARNTRRVLGISAEPPPCAFIAEHFITF